MNINRVVQSVVLCSYASTALFIGAAGCHEDKPHEYGGERPSIGDLYEGDKGLQSKDVVEASDKMAAALLALPELNASKNQWLIVVDRVDNQTSDPRANLDIFLNRLKTSLFQKGRGRVQLIENMAKLHELQSRELEGAAAPSDTYGQGSGNRSAGGGPAGIQPDYSLYAKMT